MNRDAQDSRILLRAMVGYDPPDSTSAAAPVPGYDAMLTGDIKVFRTGRV